MIKAISPVLHTKWGTAHLTEHGYYQIKTREHNNHGKMLHRLIYEDFWGVTLPSEIHIHHKDENKANNCILNLEAVTNAEHNTIHKTGSKHSKETIDKLKLAHGGENHPYYGKHLPKKVREKISNTLQGRKVPINTCLNMSKSHNSTGFFRVHKHNSSSVKQGFVWRYQYTDENNVRRNIESIDLEKLEQKVRSKGLEWRRLDET